MTELYLIRHAEAEGNLYRRIHGWYDGRLTAMGLKQVRALEKRFENVRVDAVYSSDLSRTRDTAAAIYLPKGLPLVTTPELREVGMGEWEDKCWGWADRFRREQLSYFNFEPEKWSVEGSESFAAALERTENAVRRIARENDGRTAAIVSHGSVIRMLLIKLLGASGPDGVLYCDNTAVARLTAENGVISVDYHNDNSHLSPEISAFHRDTWWKEKDARDGRDMYFLPMDVFAGGDTYLRRYREACIQSHGSDFGFTDVYLDWARRRASSDPDTVMEAFLDGVPCGMLELAEKSGAEEGYGHISLIYLEKEFRGKGLAIQLVGQAVSYYRRRGRKALRLRVAPDNAAALKFYNEAGFAETLREEGSFGTVVTMCKDI